MENPKQFIEEQQPSESAEALPHLLYHTHLHLTSHSPPKSSSSRPTSWLSSPRPTTMVTHIAEQASDSIKVQTASTVQYRRAHLSSDASVVIKSPSIGSVSSHHRRDNSPHSTITSSYSMAPSQRMRHVRHPSNVPVYTTSSPTPNNRTRSRRLRESLKPLIQIFTPADPSTTPPLDTNRQLDQSRKLGSKAKVLQEADPNTRQSRRSLSSQFSTSKDSHHSQSPQQRPTRYFRREQSNAAIVEELKCEGLLGGGPTKRSRKRKGRADSPNLEKPLPPLVPSMTRRNSDDTFYWESNNCEEKYWAGVADDIARRVSMLTQ